MTDEVKLTINLVKLPNKNPTISSITISFDNPDALVVDRNSDNLQAAVAINSTLGRQLRSAIDSLEDLFEKT